MKLNCEHVSVSEAGGDYFQVLFKKHEKGEGPYLLIQRGFEFDEDEAPDPCYVETHEQRFIGHFTGLGANLSRNRFILRLPPPHRETIQVDFETPDRNFREVMRALRIILHEDLQTDVNNDANH